MKKIILLCLLCHWAGIVSASDSTSPYIDVSATATVKVAPNIMRWAVNIQTIGADLNDVSYTHDNSLKSVLKQVKTTGIDKTSLQTSNITLGEHYVYRDRNRIKEGYKANTQILFNLQQFDDYSKLWRALASFDTVTIQSISYDHTDRTELENQALTKALKAAKHKAKLMATTMDMTLGEPISIRENTSQYGPRVAQRSVAFAAETESASTSIEPGQIAIQSQVNLVINLSALK